jgi:hypothetical protein
MNFIKTRQIIFVLEIAFCFLAFVLALKIVGSTNISESSAQTNFQIVIQREKTEKRGNYTAVLGTISINGEEIGKTVENDDLKIVAGAYKGLLRYWSKRGFAQGPFGTYGKEGDFLLEISGVSGRSDLLFHGGNQPWHSKGCVLLGPVAKQDGIPILSEKLNAPLLKLRSLFYGTEVPISTPDKNITITIIDIPEETEEAVNPNAKCVSEKCKKYKTLFRKLKEYEVELLKPCNAFTEVNKAYTDCMANANRKYQIRQKEVDDIFAGDEEGLLDCSDGADDAPVCGRTYPKSLQKYSNKWSFR